MLSRTWRRALQQRVGASEGRYSVHHFLIFCFFLVEKSVRHPILKQMITARRTNQYYFCTGGGRVAESACPLIWTLVTGDIAVGGGGGFVGYLTRNSHIVKIWILALVRTCCSSRQALSIEPFVTGIH